MTFYIVTIYDELGYKMLETKTESYTIASQYLFKAHLNPETAAGKIERVTELNGAIVASFTLALEMWKPVKDSQLQTEYFSRKK